MLQLSLIICFVHIFEVESYCLGPNPLIFMRQPHDVTLSEGGNATFTCKVRNFDPTTDSITWQVDPPLHDIDVTETNDTASHEFTSSITAYKVGREIQFWCTFNSVLISIQKGRVTQDRICFTSKVAKTTLRQFPEESELSCGPQNPGPLVEESSLQVYCVVPRCHPPLNISWTFPGRIDSNHISDSFDGQYRVLKVDIITSLGMHSKTLTCVVTGKIGQRLECPIGPFNILHFPRLTIDPVDVLTNATTNVTLSCTSNGFVPASEYLWTCLPSDVLLGCTSTSSTIHVSFNSHAHVTFKRNVTATVKCSALNGGTKWISSNISTLVIAHLFDDELNFREVFDSLTMKIYNVRKTDKNSWNIDLICTFASNIYYQPEVRWYLNDRLSSIPSNKTINESLYMSVIQLTNMSLSDNGKVVACEIGIEKERVRVNYSLLLEDDLIETSVDQNNPPPTLCSNQHTVAMDPNSGLITEHSLRYTKDVSSQTNKSFLEHFMFNPQQHQDELQSSVTQFKYVIAVTIAAVFAFVITVLSFCFAITMCRNRLKGKEHVKSRNNDSNDIENHDKIQHIDDLSQETGNEPIYEVPKFDEFQSFSVDVPITSQHNYSTNVFQSLASTSSSSSSSWSSISDANNTDFSPTVKRSGKNLSQGKLDDLSLEYPLFTLYNEPSVLDMLRSQRRKNSAFNVLLLNVPESKTMDGGIGDRRESLSLESVSTLSTHSFESPLLIRDNLPPLPSLSVLSQEVALLPVINTQYSSRQIPLNPSLRHAGEEHSFTYYQRSPSPTFMLPLSPPTTHPAPTHPPPPNT